MKGGQVVEQTSQIRMTCRRWAEQVVGHPLGGVTLMGLALSVIMLGPSSAGCAERRSSPASLMATKSKPAPCPGRPNCGSALGTNLARLRDYSSEWAFVDAFKQSRAWISSSEGQWDDKRPFDLDAHGWVRSLAPGQWARTLLFWRDGGLQFPSGDYVVLFDGDGTIEYGGNAKPVRTQPGRHVIRVKPTGQGISIIIKNVNTANYIRNIRVIMPGGVCSNDPFVWCQSGSDCGKGSCQSFERVYARQLFHPTFLDRIKSYRVLRFMPWLDTNNSEQRGPEDRPRLDDARWTIKGVPLEVTIELCNRLGADPWFTMPHLATDEYILHFAKLVRDQLDPDLRVYVEYSNEVWNNQFKQARFAAEEGSKAGLSPNRFTAQLMFYSQNAVRTFDLWQRVFKGRDRLVRVMASQAANAWVSRTVLEHQNAAKKTDALAIAPYFGGDLGDPKRYKRVAAMSPSALLDELAGPGLEKVAQWMAEHAKLAKKHNLALIAYEGGQHLVGVGHAGQDAKLNALFDAVNRSPRMREIYLRYLENWKSKGGGLFVHYLNCSQSDRYGRWGALESLLQDPKSAPKFNALQEFRVKNPPWW